jgi:hypothetical protein
VLIWTIFLVLVRGTRAQNLSAPFSYTLFKRRSPWYVWYFIYKIILHRFKMRILFTYTIFQSDCWEVRIRTLYPWQDALGHMYTASVTVSYTKLCKPHRIRTTPASNSETLPTTHVNNEHYGGFTIRIIEVAWWRDVVHMTVACCSMTLYTWLMTSQDCAMREKRHPHQCLHNLGNGRGIPVLNLPPH